MKKVLGLVFVVLVLGGWASGPGRSASEGTLIVLNKSEANGALIDLKTGESLATFAAGKNPHEVAVSPDGKLAVVSNYVEHNPGASLTLIDLENKESAGKIDLGEYSKPHGLAFFPDGRHLLVTAESHKVLLIVDVKRKIVEKTLDTQQEVSHMVVLSPDARLAFVANIRSGSVSVIDLVSGTVKKIIKTGKGAEGLAISPDGQEVWVTNRAEDSISIIRVNDLRVIATIPCPGFPIRVQFTPDGQWALVSCPKAGDVAVIQVASREVKRRIPMRLTAKSDRDDRLFRDVFGDSPVPIGILIHPSGKTAYVANSNADAVAVVDLVTWKVIDYLKTGKQPDGLGFSPLHLQ